MFILTFNYETPPVYFPFTDYQNQIRFFKYNLRTPCPKVPFRKFLDFVFQVLHLLLSLHFSENIL